MATLDIILLVCLLPGIIRGLSKGFLEQALALVGVVVSVWAAFQFSNPVSALLKPYLSVSETVLSVISFALVLVVVALAAVLLGKLLTKLLELAMLGWLDKTLGLVLALAVNALAIVEGCAAACLHADGVEVALQGILLVRGQGPCHHRD